MSSELLTKELGSVKVSDLGKGDKEVGGGVSVIVVEALVHCAAGRGDDKAIRDNVVLGPVVVNLRG